MKKQQKKWITAGLTGIMVLAGAVSSMAQSYGIADYSDTYTTDGVEREFRTTDDLVWNVPVCDLTNRDFTITVNCDDLTDNIGMPFRVDMVWVGEIEDGIAYPITSSPFEPDDGPKVHQTGENTYDLSGLEIKEGVVYGFFMELSSFVPANAAQGSSIATHATFFRINSVNAAVPDSVQNDGLTQNADAASDDRDGSGGSSIYYYWASNETGWWVQCSNGSFLTNQWYQSPTSGLWYYLGADGYMLTDTKTPDGYYVNADGIWIG